MSRFGRPLQYSQWDGRQEAASRGADDIMAALSDELMNHGDLRLAMRNLLRGGLDSNAPMQGLRDMLRKLRQERRERLERYNIAGIMDDIQARLDAIINAERASLNAMGEPRRSAGGDDIQSAGLDDTLAPSQPPHPSKGEPGPPLADDTDAQRSPGPQDASFAASLMQEIAERNIDILNQLPVDAPGRVKALQTYEFTSPTAQQLFEELLDELRQAMTKTFFNDVEKMVTEMSANDIDRMKAMIRDLNEMLVRHIGGLDPEFDDFMQTYGDMFGQEPPASIEALIAQMQDQIAAMHSLMLSMPTEQFEQLQNLLRENLGDSALNQGLRNLAQKLDFLDPNKGQKYRFSGDENLDLNAAMGLMDEMHDLEQLERELGAAHANGDLEQIDREKLEALLGSEANDALLKMDEMVKLLEQAGYIDRNGAATELTARGMKMIGRKALQEIFSDLTRHSLGNHQLPQQGRFGERIDDTKPYEFGDPLSLHMSRTLQNALRRGGPRPQEIGQGRAQVTLAADDFEVYRHEQTTRTSTVLLVDLSWSMELRGAFVAAKKVALALNNLITSSYPRDDFYVVGFSAYAAQLQPHEIPFLALDEYVLGTNMHHALLVAERLLSRAKGGTKQILMITDGEPTAHIEHGQAQFAYPPSPRTIRETLRAVKHCTRQRITINTFVLDESYHLQTFIENVTKINGGRAFYASPERLGEYVLVDYVNHKRKIVGRS